MKKVITAIALISIIGTIKVNGLDTPQPSPLQKIEQRIGLTDIKLVYHRPQMRGRKIFGELVPLNQLWRSGANENTTINISTPVTIKDKPLKAGTYALFTKPMENNWEIYFYKNTNNWGLPRSWDESEVILKFTVPVKKLNTVIDAFTISMDNITENSINVGLAWEKTYVAIPIKIDVDAIVSNKIKEGLKGPTADDYYSAADYYYENGKGLKQAKDWIDMAVEKSKEKPFYLYNTKQALIHYKLGNKKEAIKMSENALKISKKANSKWGININEKMLKEWKKG